MCSAAQMHYIMKLVMLFHIMTLVIARLCSSGSGTRRVYDLLLTLQVKAGADALTIKRKYKELAVALHPDKCKVSSTLTVPPLACL